MPSKQTIRHGHASRPSSRKCADDCALVEHLFDISSDILGVDQPSWKA
jgi:hypothetical protein